MIKRALGVWADGDASDDDSEQEGITEAQTRKLYQRLLPGAGGRGGKGASKGAQERSSKQDCEESEESDEEDNEKDAESQGKDGQSDYDYDEPAVPAAADKDVKFRGNFRCELCPDKILLTEKALEDHLKSAAHKRNEKRFEHAKEIGVEAYIQECTERMEARQAQQGPSKNVSKKKAYWQELKRKGREKNKKDRAKGKVKEIDEGKLAFLKAKFQAKKTRRMERKVAAAEEAAKAKEPEVSAKGMKEKRRAKHEVPQHKCGSRAEGPAGKRRKKVRE